MPVAIYVSGSSKTQTLLPSNVIEISPQSFKFCNSVEKYQILLDNVWILLEPLIYVWLHDKFSFVVGECHETKLMALQGVFNSSIIMLHATITYN